MSSALGWKISKRGSAICSSLSQLSQTHCIQGAELRIGQVHAIQDGPWPLQSARSPLSCVPPGILARMRIERAARLLSSCPPGPDDESGRPALQGRGGSHLLPKEMRKSYLAFMPRLGV